MLVAVLGASLNVIKFCLMYIPNVEAVTLLVAVYTYCFGISVGLPATVVFCTIEGLLFGFNPTWLVSYYIHWGFVAFSAFALKQLKIKNSVIITLVMGCVTALFGLQSTFIYFLIGGAVGKENWVNSFWAMYLSGWVFYLVQVVCNIILFLFAFKPVTKVLDKLGKKYFLN